jgi:ABC-2 type transport system ATP-binding protein
MTASGTKVRIGSVTKRYADTVAVHDLTLEVAGGEMFGLIGPDGAGKTTTLRLILGLLAADEGTVSTCGLDPRRQHREVSDRVGYLSQRFSLYGDLTVDENVAFFAEIHGVGGWRERRDELLRTMRLDAFRDRLAERLSGGMKQKLALACTLVHTPELLVLDEPTTGVDPVSRRDFWKVLSRLQRAGLTIVLATPYLDEAERCNRVALVHRGELLAMDTPDALRDQEAGALLEMVVRPRRRAVEILEKDRAVGEVVTFGERLHVALPGTSRDGAVSEERRLQGLLSGAGVEIQSSRLSRPSLEDVFIRRIEARS